MVGLHQISSSRMPWSEAARPSGWSRWHPHNTSGIIRGMLKGPALAKAKRRLKGSAHAHPAGKKGFSVRKGKVRGSEVSGARRQRPPRKANLAVSFDPTLANRVRGAAEKESGGNVSAWLAEAAREKLRLDAGWAAVKSYEAEHGKISADALARVDREWPA